MCYPKPRTSSSIQPERSQTVSIRILWQPRSDSISLRIPPPKERATAIEKSEERIVGPVLQSADQGQSQPSCFGSSQTMAH